MRAGAATSPLPRLYTIPGNEFAGEGSEVTLVIGANAPDGKGNVTAYATYRQNNPILEAQRDFSACTLTSTAAAIFASSSRARCSR